VVRRLTTRRAWFTEGARALRAELRTRGLEDRLPSDEDWYACPLCLDILFTIEVLDEPDPMLTAEHAPPDWAGGTELALTCKRCNNESGRLFDAEAQKAAPHPRVPGRPVRRTAPDGDHDRRCHHLRRLAHVRPHRHVRGRRAPGK
jgi:hypothetical protein